MRIWFWQQVSVKFWSMYLHSEFRIVYCCLVYYNAFINRVSVLTTWEASVVVAEQAGMNKMFLNGKDERNDKNTFQGLEMGAIAWERICLWLCLEVWTGNSMEWDSTTTISTSICQGMGEATWLSVKSHPPWVGTCKAWSLLATWFLGCLPFQRRGLSMDSPWQEGYLTIRQKWAIQVLETVSWFSLCSTGWMTI